jgi:polar amino acid transport system permease protein
MSPHQHSSLAVLPSQMASLTTTNILDPTRLLGVLLLTACAISVSTAVAQPIQSVPSGTLMTVAKWLPLIFSGFLFNLVISVFAMALGTALGVFLGLGLIALNRPVRATSWTLMQFFRNAPWLVILFYAMFLIPFQFRVFGFTVPFPDTVKAVIGLALPVMANVAEIVRGGIMSIPLGQWESAESLAFTRRQILWQIILPQAVKRMLPPWMNLYAILTMATPLISIVGVQDGLTMTRGALVAESRPELLIPMYLALLLMFFAYCYPIALATRALERRFDVKN